MGALKAKQESFRKKSIGDKNTAHAKSDSKEILLKAQLAALLEAATVSKKNTKVLNTTIASQKRQITKLEEAAKHQLNRTSDSNRDLVLALAERDGFKKQLRIAEAELKKLHQKVNDQGDKQPAHDLEMAQIVLKAKEVALETTTAKSVAGIKKNKAIFKEKRGFSAYQAQVWSSKKEKTAKVKQRAADSKQERLNDHFTIAASVQSQQNIGLRGGTFPPPTPLGSIVLVSPFG